LNVAVLAFDKGNNALIRAVRDDSRRDFKVLFDHLYPLLCAYAMRFLDDWQACEDVTQDALLKYWRQRKKFSFYGEASGFLYAAVRNQCSNILRKGAVNERYAASVQGSVEEDVFEGEVAELLRRAVAGLPGQMRRVIECSMAGMRNAEIAGSMGIAEGSVHTLKKIAYRKLREALGEELREGI
jgi:RNA polymerase sigma-70 factor (ECF subfamily)